ncbi:MAG: hypothetical protein WA294_03280 [Acidobacteriaceae bacterium]
MKSTNHIPPRRIDFSRRFLLFIPVETRRSRRTVVIGYYLFFAAFGILLVWSRGPAKYDRLLPLSFYLATMLGGLTFSGPVRVFSQWQRKLVATPDQPGDGPLGLSTLGATAPRSIDRLDEHDIAVRDRAHYLAYSALRWPAILAALFGGIYLFDASPDQLAHVFLIASVPVAALFFSLPRAIILWTEPDLDAAPADFAVSGVRHA